MISRLPRPKLQTLDCAPEVRSSPEVCVSTKPLTRSREQTPEHRTVHKAKVGPQPTKMAGGQLPRQMSEAMQRSSKRQHCLKRKLRGRSSPKSPSQKIDPQSSIIPGTLDRDPNRPRDPDAGTIASRLLVLVPQPLRCACEVGPVRAVILTLKIA